MLVCHPAYPTKKEWKWASLTMEERSTQQDFRWYEVEVHDTREGWNEESVAGLKNMAVYEQIFRDEAQRYPLGKTAKVELVRINNCTEECLEIRCRAWYVQCNGQLCAIGVRLRRM